MTRSGPKPLSTSSQISKTRSKVTSTMKITAITMLLMWLLVPPQIRMLEKQALHTVQRMPVSQLDAELPRYPFSTWFNKVIGPEAGVVWQLTECGEQIDQQNGAERDLIACTEAAA